MLRLVTGSPGDGKTSNELWDFLNADQYKGRPKYCTPIKGFEPEKHGVKLIEHIDCWEELPDGSVIFCDEAQDFCGNDIGIGKEPPHWAKQLAKHRHRGFDFVLTTQSPMYIHSFVRKLCKPHVNYIRPWNMKGFQYTWDSVQNDPNAKSSKAMGTRKAVAPNPEVFKLYTSTLLDTHKARPPWKIIIILAVLTFVTIAGSIFAAYRLSSLSKPADAVAVKTDPKQLAAAERPKGDFEHSLNIDEGQKPRWSKETTTPAITGIAYTAPVYDELTAPTDFPRVAACVQSVERSTCDCYTQQATPIDVPLGACIVYVRYGSFDPWLTGRKQFKSQAQQSQIAQSQPQSQMDTQQQKSVPRQTFAVVEDHTRSLNTKTTQTSP